MKKKQRETESMVSKMTQQNVSIKKKLDAMREQNICLTRDNKRLKAETKELAQLGLYKEKCNVESLKAEEKERNRQSIERVAQIKRNAEEAKLKQKETLT